MISEQRMRIVLQGAIAFIFVMAALACLSGGMTPELERLGYPKYFSFILGPAYLLGVVSIYQQRYPFLQEWAIGAIAVNLIGASASHILAGDSIVKALPSFIIQALFIWFYILRLKEKNKETTKVETQG
ncbi:MAG: DoxX family protein [Bacteroidota bacterium]